MALSFESLAVPNIFILKGTVTVILLMNSDCEEVPFQYKNYGPYKVRK